MRSGLGVLRHRGRQPEPGLFFLQSGYASTLSQHIPSTQTMYTVGRRLLDHVWTEIRCRLESRNAGLWGTLQGGVTVSLRIAHRFQQPGVARAADGQASPIREKGPDGPDAFLEVPNFHRVPSSREEGSAKGG